jgi:hypothetical protein
MPGASRAGVVLLLSGKPARLNGVPWYQSAPRALTKKNWATSVRRLRPVLRLFQKDQLIGVARHFAKTPHSTNSLLNSAPPGSQDDQSPAYVSYFHFALVHMFSVLRIQRRDDPGFSG